MIRLLALAAGDMHAFFVETVEQLFICNDSTGQVYALLMVK
jgi:hypothetical protein